MSIFHYTKGIDTLKLILSGGVRLAYCKEIFYDVEDITVYIPMACFCDIPIEKAGKHAGKYGKFAIGLYKSKIIDEKRGTYLNPVNYYMNFNYIDALKRQYEEIRRADNKLLESLRISAPETMEKILLSPGRWTREIPYGEISDILKMDEKLYWEHYRIAHQVFHATLALGYSKPYNDTDKDGNKIINYEEHEWRSIIPDGAMYGSERVCWFWSEEEFELWKKKNNMENKPPLLTQYLPMHPIFISHIIIPDEDSKNEIEAYINELDWMCNHSLSHEQKEVLISKILIVNLKDRD